MATTKAALPYRIIAVINSVWPRALFYIYDASPGFRAWFWNMRVADIHRQWGERDEDEKVDMLLGVTGATTVLDLGAGTGAIIASLVKRLEPASIIAQDISPQALGEVHKKFPDVQRRNVSVLELVDKVDLVISNRVLAAIPGKEIGAHLAAICSLTRYVYLNESTYDAEHADYYCWRVHDYDAHLVEHGFVEIAGGDGWKLFGLHSPS